MSTGGRVSIKVRQMFIKHLDDVKSIEDNSFEHPWSADEIKSARKSHISKIALVTPKGSESSIVAGYLFAEREKHRFNILSVAVHEEWRRKGIGSKLLKYLINLLSRNGQAEMYKLVRETNLTAQKFCRDMGFVASRPKQNVYDETKEDAYPMIYKWEWSPRGIAHNGTPDSCLLRNHLCIDCGDCY